jgi:transglutaminase-like putative cysteine protease
LYHKYALTILNEKGDKHAQLVLDYDKLHKIKEINGALYDAQGKQIRKLKPKEVQDVSGVDDNSLIDDNRRKYFSFYHKVYPYTVEFEVVTEYNNTLFFPMWLPQEDENYAVEQSRLTVWCPQDYNVRFKSFNYNEQPVMGTDKNQKSLQWEIKNKEAVAYEFGLPSWLDITTSVLLAPSHFKIENYTGDMTDWKAFGQFVYTLKQGRDLLPDAIKHKVHALTDHLSNPKDKIQALYQYLQQNNRYVSIQLGLGGWQPFDAKYVASKGYGDCKALTNYMHSLLKETGIPSYYT